MHTRKLGQSGIDISSIGLGTNYVGGHNLYQGVDEAEGVRLVQRALDLGITHIDTADVYGFGRSEELVGQAIKGRRNGVVLATKGGNMFGGGQRGGVNNDPTYLRGALEASLRRLGTDHVDLYYIHRHDDQTPAEDAYGALMRFKDEGLIRAGGVSNFAPTQLLGALRAGPVDALQSQYNMLQRAAEAEVLALCVAHGISFIPWGPLAYGLLGGRYVRDFELPQDDWRHRTGVFDAQSYPRNMDTVDQMKRIAAERGLRTADLAIQWLLSRPAVSSVIAGAKRASQVEDNAAADAVELTRAELVALDVLVNT